VNELNIVCAGDTPPVRWKNNGGWTRELLAWPQAGDWTLRISVADIEADGPFSSFPGIARFFAVLSGDGVRLDVDGSEQLLDTHSPLFAFAGEAATGCRLLGGATRDFNLMLRREHASAHCWPAHDGAAAVPGADWTGLFTVAGGRVRAATDRAWLDVPPLSLVWTCAPTPCQAELSDAGARAWWMQLKTKEAHA
jgi:environmental stress-induced protein Ves